MTITDEQRKRLYKYLNEIFIYRESLTEVYDHVLTAAEHYEGDLPYEEVITKIIQYDFGGAQKLVDLEREYKKSVATELRSRLWKTFFYNLKYKSFLLVVAVGIAIFYAKLNLLSKPALITVFLTYFLLSIADYFYQPYKSGYLNLDKKESVNDKILNNLLTFPNRFLGIAVGLLFAKLPQLQYSLTATLIIVAVVYILLPLFVCSYYQAFKQEYKLRTR